MSEKELGMCIAYDGENGECKLARSGGHLLINGHLGIECPYDAFVLKCNEEFYRTQALFSDDPELQRRQVLANLRYGYVPDSGIPLDSLDTSGNVMDELSEGAKIHYPDGIIEILSGNTRKPMN